MNSNKKKLYIIAGPTGIGKTKYSIEFAKKINGEIVSLDSVQIYKYLDIGSAKIKEEEKQGIKHYMIDILEPYVNFNVKVFKDMAKQYINEIYDKGKIPILVGGTGFYIRAILYDTDFLEEDDNLAKSIKDELYKIKKKEGIDTIYKMLYEVDKESAETIPIQNEKRIFRALQFYKLHGFPISLHNKNEKLKKSIYDFEFYVLQCDRNILYDRINKRIDNMIEEGLLIEIKKLIDMGIKKDCNSMKSIGYNELYDFCKARNEILSIDNLSNEDKLLLKEKIDLIKQHSRNYAKRQITWFKNQNNIKWVNLYEK